MFAKRWFGQRFFPTRFFPGVGASAYKVIIINSIIENVTIKSSIIENLKITPFIN